MDTSIPFAEVTQADVLFGRGKRVHNWQGNQQFRKLVSERAALYRDPAQRDALTKQVIDTIKENGGRFLREKTKLENMDLGLPVECWDEVPPSVVRRKVKQALRDAGSKIVASSDQSKKRNDGTSAEGSIPPPVGSNVSLLPASCDTVHHQQREDSLDRPDQPSTSSLSRDSQREHSQDSKLPPPST